MSKLVDKARLQKLAQALDARMKEAVKGVQDQLDALQGEGEGSVADQLAALKTELQKEIDADVKVVSDELAKQKDAEQEGTLAKKIADEVARATGQEAAIRQEMATEATRVNQKIADDIKVVTDAQKEVNDDFEERIAANEAFVEAHSHESMEDRLDALEAKFEGDQSVDAKIAAAKAAAEAEAARLDGVLKQELQDEIDADVKVVADELAKQMDPKQAGTLAKQIADEKARMDAFMLDADVQQGAIDTLLELQTYIDEHGEAAKKMVDDIAANAKAIEDEAKRAAAEEARIEGKFDEIVGEHSVVADPENGVEGKEGSGLRKEIEVAKNNAESYTDAKVQEINGNMAVLAQSIGGQIDELSTAIGNEKTRAEGKEAELAQAIANEKAALQKEIDDDVKVEKERAEGQEAAIREEFVEADEALHTTIKGEMASIVGSLSVKFEGDELVIGLGDGVDFVTLNKQPVEMVTDDDIDEIIAGLDPVEGE